MVPIYNTHCVLINDDDDEDETIPVHRQRLAQAVQCVRVQAARMPASQHHARDGEGRRPVPKMYRR